MENTELNNVQLKIKLIYTKIEAKHFDVVIGDYVYEEYETKEHLNQWFRESIKTLHYLIQVYLELKQMPLFLKTFKEKFDNLNVELLYYINLFLFHYTLLFILKLFRQVLKLF